MRRFKFAAMAITSAAVTTLKSMQASATPVRVTVTNTATAGGFFLTPVYFGFHNGSVDFFDAGSAASAGIEEIAEVGMAGTLAGERQAAQPGTTVGRTADMTPLAPGETRTFVVDLDAVDNQYLFFASMLLPSNDTFIGVDNPTMFDLFDDTGNLITQTINATTAFAFDAGTEVNDPANGPAFVQGQVITDGVVEGGVISAASSLDDFLGLTLANGGQLQADAISFFNNPNFSFASIQISEVPLPPTIGMMALGIAGFRVMRKRKALKE